MTQLVCEHPFGESGLNDVGPVEAVAYVCVSCRRTAPELQALSPVHAIGAHNGRLSTRRTAAGLEEVALLDEVGLETVDETLDAVEAEALAFMVEIEVDVVDAATAAG